MLPALGLLPANLRAPPPPPHAQPLHNRPKLPPGSNSRLKLEVSLAMHSDSTMAVEVALSEALLNWPYFQDLSLVGRGCGVLHTPRGAGVMVAVWRKEQGAPPPALTNPSPD